MLGVFPIAPFGFHAQHVYNLIYIVHFLCMDFFGIISIMFVIGCIRLEGGVLDSYYVSCYHPPARPLADREASA